MSDAAWMARCLDLARQAEGRTAPNPLVGAVIVRDGEVVGEGWHARAGLDHAEIVALRQAGKKAWGSTLYVNLEPCAHHGRTPPCTDAILASGVRRVVAGMVDPHALVNGAGIRRLEGAGLEVVVGVIERECRALNRPFITAVTLGRPMVVLKAAASLDGRISTVAGESRWVTGEPARLHGHELRNRLDAILVGRVTAESDDPRLDCRLPGGRDPVPVLLDTSLKVPFHAKMFHGSRQAIVYCGKGTPVPSDHPARVIPLGEDAGTLPVRDVLSDLVTRGVHSVLVEGGGRVHRSFLDAGVVDRVLLYLAPKVFAGGPGWVGGDGIPRIGDAHRFTLLDTARLGDDLLLDLGVSCSRD